MSQHLWE